MKDRCASLTPVADLLLEATRQALSRYVKGIDEDMARLAAGYEKAKGSLTGFPFR